MSEHPDAAHLVAMILDWDLTYAEIEKICSQFLGLQGETLEFVLGRSQDSWQHRVEDLVGWADRQGLLAELAGGVMYYGSVKRSARQWMLSNGSPMPNPDGSSQIGAQAWLEIKLDIAQIKTDIAQIRRDQTDMSSRVGMIESNPQRPSPMIDLLIVALLAIAMIGMFGFNLLVLR